jgi:ADP-ribose pyrophosphatase YjhB (NUDIX family)
VVSGYLDAARFELRRLEKLGEDALAQVRDEALHARIDPESNSLAVLVQHLAGNMLSRWTDFLTSDGEKPERDRDAEFEAHTQWSRAEVVELWERGWRSVFAALEPLGEADLARSVTIRGEPLTVLEAVNRQLVHYAGHVGQIVFLAKHLAGDRWRSLSIPKGRSRGHWPYKGTGAGAARDTRPEWLRWAQRLQAIAQAGLTYAKDPYDRERYGELRALSVAIAASHVGASPPALAPVFAAGTGYPTPKLDVRSVVFREEAILLVRERASGRWTLPGGWADVGDTPGEVAARETEEEAGYRVRPVKLLALFDKTRHGHPPALDYVYKLFVACELLGGEPTTSHETDAVGFFGEGELPPLDTERTTAEQVRLMFVHHAQPHRPTDFD